MKTISYPRFPGLVIAEAEGDARSLNQEVWKHEKEARRRAMPLVIEVYARSVLASRRLTEWWQSGDQLMQDTLSGVYLLRVDLQKFGPESILKLTPYAVAGVPLFVGWNQVGQVCSRTQFQELTREAFALPLSAFIEDVLVGRQHTLNPAPSLGNAERTREALALKRASVALLTTKRATESAVHEVMVNESERVQPSEDAASAHQEPLETASVLPLAREVTRTEEAKRNLEQFDIDLLLERARFKFGALEDRVGKKLELTLEDLRTIDDYLAQLSEGERETFARDLGAVLAVYVGDTIRERIKADWVLSTPGRVSSALELRGNVLGEDKCIQPMEWVIEILSDSTRSLYGQALGWCRIY